MSFFKTISERKALEAFSSILKPSLFSFSLFFMFAFLACEQLVREHASGRHSLYDDDISKSGYLVSFH